jgi:hypothetical protein
MQVSATAMIPGDYILCIRCTFVCCHTSRVSALRDPQCDVAEKLLPWQGRGIRACNQPLVHQHTGSRAAAELQVSLLSFVESPITPPMHFQPLHR